MRKAISVDALRVGMAVVDVAGSWLDHGLWKTRFVIRDSNDLKAIRESGVAEVVIDTDLGLDVSRPGTLAQAAIASPVLVAPVPNAPVLEREPTPPMRRRTPGETWGRVQALVADTFGRLRSSQLIDQAAVAGAIDDIIGMLDKDRFAMMGLALLRDYDSYTYAHSVSVCALMVAFGMHLKLDAAHCHALGMAGLFHDIGKAAVSEELILKKGPLTDDEFKLVKQHPALGAEYLEQLHQSCPIAIDVCLRHHERFDGSGYLSGIKGDQMSLEARMAAICDVYDAVTSARPYKEGWDPAVALSRMASWTGHFDRQLLASFVSMLSPYPIGSLVRLSSGRVGVVVQPSPERPRKAIVQVFYNAASHSHITPRRVDLAQGNDEIRNLEYDGGWNAKTLHAVRQRALLAA